MIAIQIEHDVATSRFSTRVDGQVAELTYRLGGGRMTIEHTGVPDAIGGRGIAGQLVKAALEYARSEALRVVPACSYSEAYIRKHPEYADLVDV